jgi:hypothetical protein
VVTWPPCRLGATTRLSAVRDREPVRTVLGATVCLAPVTSQLSH